MKPDFSESKILTQQLISGNEKAYNYLVDKYYQRLCAYATSLSHDAFSSDDIVQNVFIRVWENRRTLNVNFSLKSFLFRSVYNEYIDQYRKNVAVTTLEKKYVDEINAFFEEDNPNLESLISKVKEEIEKLPAKCRATFKLSKFEGLTYVEIAEHQNISVKTVENHMNKAFAVIRKNIDNKTHGIFFFLFETRSSLSKIISPHTCFGLKP